ncbi:MAG: RNA-binding S4 domain-containing protein [Deferribacteres bacterium]|nr:RNA-binding S4 domain-containing protein [candidate division KSB1 bacterium]MCB9510366.1 RNA-binding S4 domain-containing protein [Deferribacteres bacterium]
MEMRIDKWLKMARIFKKRNEAADACGLGRVKLNGQVAKASREVKVGDQIVVKIGSRYRELEILEIPTRGLSGKDAKLAYKDNTPEIPDETVELIKLQRRFERQNPRKYKGRPTKKERRDWQKNQEH